MKIAFAIAGLTLFAVFAGVTYWLIGKLGRREDSEDAKAAYLKYLWGRSPGLRHMRVTDRERRLIRVTWMVAWSATAATILMFLFVMEP